MHFMRQINFLTAIALLFLAPGMLAFGQTTQPAPVDFEKDIQPILTVSCATAGCHVPGGSGPMSLQAGVAYTNLVNPTTQSNPPRVVPKDPTKSQLIQRLEGTFPPQMPQGRTPLPQAQIDLFKRWITEGALAKAAVAGSITTYAGRGTSGFSGDGGPAIQASLFNPTGVALDAKGNLYIADHFNHRIRRVSSDGIITTAAGTGTLGFSGDGGSAAQANLSNPNGVAVDANGAIYFAEFSDATNHRVRRVGTDGVITTFAGMGAQGFSGDGGQAAQAQLRGPYGVAVDPTGVVYIAESGNHRVRRVGLNGIITTFAGGGTSGLGDGGPAVQAQLNEPSGVAVDTKGNVYIADTQNHRIRRVGPNGIITTFAGTGTSGFSGDGGSASQARLNVPYGVAVDAKGDVYIADRDNQRIRRVGSDGIITTFAGGGSSLGDGGPAIQASLNRPYGVAVDAAGAVYVADNNNHRIRRVEGAGVTEVAGVEGHIATLDAQSGTVSLYTGISLPASPVTVVDATGRESTAGGTTLQGLLRVGIAVAVDYRQEAGGPRVATRIQIAGAGGLPAIPDQANRLKGTIGDASVTATGGFVRLLFFAFRVANDTKIFDEKGVAIGPGNLRRDDRVRVTPAPTQPGPPQTPVATEVRVLDRAAQPGPTPVGVKVNLVSVKLDGKVVQKQTKTDPVAPGRHTVEFTFDTALNIHLDPKAGEFDVAGVDLALLPFPSQFPDIAVSPDRKGFSVTLDLPANTTYQLVVITNIDTDDDTEETFSDFYFGTTALSDAKVSGSILPPAEAEDAEIGDGIALLLTVPPEEIFGNEGSSKVARAAKRVAARLMKAGPEQDDGEGGDEDIEERLFQVSLRASLIQDMNFSFLFVPNGQYYILTSADVEVNGQYGEVFGVYDIDGDGEADPVVVQRGRSVEGLEIATVLLTEGKEPPPPAIRGVVARVELSQRQFAIGRSIEFDPDQVAVFGGQGGRITVRDLQPNFPVVVTLEHEATPLRAVEIRILRPGQVVPPGMDQTIGVIDRIEARRLFLIEQRFQFDQRTMFVDADDNPIEASRLMPGDFVEVEAMPKDPPPQYAVRVKVLPAGFIPGQNPDQVTGAAFLTRTGTVPADGATNLATNPQLQISFNGPANQDFIDQLEVVIVPYADDLFKTYEARNGRFVADLNLKANTSYTMWVVIHSGQKAPFVAHFTTGSEFPRGTVSGKVVLPASKDIPGLPEGAVLSINPASGRTGVLLMTQDPATALPLLNSDNSDDYVKFLKQIAGAGLIRPDGSYIVTGVPAGSYYVAALVDVFARRGPTGPPIPGTERSLRGFYVDQQKAGTVSLTSATIIRIEGIDIQLNPPPALRVVKVTPADNAANVPLETTLSFTFSDRLRIDDNGFVSAEIHLFPEPESGPIDRGQLSLSEDAKTVSVDVTLAGNTTYQAFVFYAESSNEGLLPASSLEAQTGFSTGAAVGTGKVSGEVAGIPGGAISRDVGLIFTYLIPAGIDLRDLGPGDFERVVAAIGVSDGNLFRAAYIPEGRYFVLVEVHRFEDEASFYGFLTDPQGKPRVLAVGKTDDIKGLRVQVSPQSPFEQETRALRVLNVQAFSDKNNNGKIESGELIDLKEGVGGVPLKTQIVVTFSEAIQVSREFVGVNAELIPAAKSGDLFGQGKFRVQDQGRQVVFTVELSADTDYQFIVRGAVGVSGAELRVSEERFFTTRSQRVALGSVTGKISLSDRSRPHGSVFASVKSGSNEIVIAQVDADSVYVFPRLPDGKYFIVVDLTLENKLKVGGFYDKNKNGKREDEDFVEIRGGNAVTGIDIALTVPTVTPPTTGGGPNAKVTASLDFGKDKGDQKQTRLENVSPATDVTVAVYVQGVKDLSGYTVTLAFDPTKLAFNGAENDNTAEGTNLLKTSGGVAVFLPPNLKGGASVEFGGAVLAATEATAPEGDGLLGVFRFKTTETFDSTTTISITRVVLKGIAGTDTVKSSAVGTVSVPGQQPPGGGATLTPKAGDGTGMVDLDVAAGDQNSRTLSGVKAGQKVDVQIILNKDYASASAFQVVLKFDPKKLSSTVTGRKDGTSFSSALDLPAQVKDNTVTYGASILGGSTTVSKGPVAILTFETLGDFTGETEIELSSLVIRVSGVNNTLTPGASVVLSSSTGGGSKPPTPDFDGDGEVGFGDFFEFAGAFGQPATGANAKYDLDGDGEIGFGDFFEFAGKFGQRISKPALAKPAGLGAAGVNGEARLGLQVVPSDVQDVVGVDLRVLGAQGLKGYGVHLSYDPSELEFIESQPEGAFETGGEARPLLRVSDGLGQVHLGDVLLSGVVTGEGALSRLTFRVRPGGGIGSLRLAEGLLLDGEGLTNRVSGVGLEGQGLVPLSYGLGQNYPNPFNPDTQILY